MAKIDTLFMTKTAEKHYPLDSHIPIAHIGEYPPTPGATLALTSANWPMQDRIQINII